MYGKKSLDKIEEGSVDVKTRESNMPLSAEVIELKKQEIDAERSKPTAKKVEVFTEQWATDPTFVLNKEDGYKYKWGRQNDAIEMTQFRMSGYEPARGNEMILGMEKPEPGKPKIREEFGRILMRCPVEKVVARNTAMMTRITAEKRDGNRNTASRLQKQAGRTVGVKEYTGMDN